MSSILKALRRLEEEKARNSNAAPEIAASLLRSHVRRSGVPRWLWPTLLVVGGAGILILLFFSFWRPLPAEQDVVEPISPPASLAVKESAGGGGVVIIEEVIDHRRPILQPSRPVAAKAPASAPLAVPRKSSPPVRSVQDSSAEPTVSRIEVRQAPVVSAIAWQEESSARMAVIDGLPTMNGEMIGSARVLEIQRDRVLFAEDGASFAVLLPSQ